MKETEEMENIPTQDFILNHGRINLEESILAFLLLIDDPTYDIICMENNMSFNQKEYIDKYNKDTYKMYQFRVRKDHKKIIEYLDKKKERNSYIVSLIDNDLDNKKVLTIKRIKELIKPILNRYGIRDIYLFGSYARGEANSKSDIDIYCDKGNIRTLIDQGKMENELEKSLKKKVDVIFESAVKDKDFEREIMKDLIKLC